MRVADLYRASAALACLDCLWLYSLKNPQIKCRLHCRACRTKGIQRAFSQYSATLSHALCRLISLQHLKFQAQQDRIVDLTSCQ